MVFTCRLSRTSMISCWDAHNRRWLQSLHKWKVAPPTKPQRWFSRLHFAIKRNYRSTLGRDYHSSKKTDFRVFQQKAQRGERQRRKERNWRSAMLKSAHYSIGEKTAQRSRKPVINESHRRRLSFSCRDCTQPTESRRSPPEGFRKAKKKTSRPGKCLIHSSGEVLIGHASARKAKREENEALWCIARGDKSTSQKESRQEEKNEISQ